MRSIIFLIVASLLTACATTSSRESMEADIDQAVSIIERFEAIPESAIPPRSHARRQRPGNSDRNESRLHRWCQGR